LQHGGLKMRMSWDVIYKVVKHKTDKFI
jgi:hypothetical protein